MLTGERESFRNQMEEERGERESFRNQMEEERGEREREHSTVRKTWEEEIYNCCCDHYD